MKKILAIDDQNDNLISIKAIIESFNPNYNIITALSGKDGIELAKKEQPDTILLDIIMPEMDGYEVCKRLKEDNITKHIPVVMLTAIRTDTESRVKGLNMGADAFLSKPIDAIELSAQVNVMLRIKEAEDKLRAEKKTLEELVLEKTFELKKSEEKYRAIYDNAPLSFQSLDVNGCFIDVNPTWMKVLGYEEKEVIGKCFSEFLHPDWKPHFKKNFKEFKRIGNVTDVQFKIKHKDGHYIDISFEGCTGLEPDGSFKQTYCVFQDITKRKLAEEALIESEERYNLAMNATRDGIYDWNLITNEIYYTPAWKKMLGYEDHELPNDFSIWENLTEAEDVKRSWEMQNEVINKKRDFFEMEFKMKHKAGHWVEILSRAEAVFDESGKAIRMIGTHIDITERKKAEEALKSSEERLKILFESAPDAYYMNNFEGKFTDGNKAAEELLGYSKEEFTGKSFVDMGILRDDEIEKALSVLGENINGKSTGPDEYTLKKKDGTKVNVEILTHPVKIAGEGMVLGIARDVTERKQAEEALKESEEKYRTLVERANDGICIIQNNQVKFINSYLAKLWGGTKKDAINTPFANYIHPDELDNLVAYYKNRMSGKYAPLKYETILKNIKGHKIYVELSAGIINYEGKPADMVLIRDITERKQTEKELKESEVRFKALHNASFGGITIHDKGIILDCNQGLSDITGFTTKELIGADGVKLLIAEESHETVIANIKAQYEKAYEVVGIRKNGDKYPLRLKAKMIPYEGKEVRSVEFRDITEQKNTETDLRVALEKATESDRLKSAFLATMSHELRTPLNAVIGFSDLISEDVPMNDIIHFGKTINESGNHLLNIVEDLFDITLIEAGEVKIVQNDVKLHSILKNVHQIIKSEQQKIKKSHIDLALTVAPKNENLIIKTDSSKLKQILLNLLKNALKFTHEGSITFGFEIESSKDPRIKFFVKDTGIGIKKESQSLIFDLFRQVDESYTKLYGGTGIGLSISKKLTKFLGGEIWLESELGKGSIFYFTIPYKLNEVEERSVKTVQHTSEKKNKLMNKTILIVEDEDSNYDYLNVILERSGVNTMRAENGKKAIAFCQENPHIDLILMDINMPIMNGYEATKEIKKFRPDLPIIAQTAYAIAGDKEKILGAGCDDYISKPIKKGEILEKIEELI